MQVSTAQDLSLYAEEVIRSLEIFSLPMTEAILHVLRYAQSEQAVFEARHLSDPLHSWSRKTYREMRGHQDILRHLIFKIHQWCPPGGDINCISGPHMGVAERAITVFEVYSLLQDNLESVKADYSTCSILGDTIQFEGQDSAISQQIDQEKNRIEEVNYDITKFYQALQGKVRIERDSTLDYRVTDPMFFLFYDASPPELLPGGLDLGPYTWGQFHLFWQYMKALAELRRFLLGRAAWQVFQANTTAYNSGAMIIGLDELRRMRHRVELRFGPASAVLEDMTYSNQTAKDVIYQPFIPLGREKFATAPLLISGSNHERNLLVLMDRLPQRADAAQRIKAVREDLMIEELRPVFEKFGFFTRERLRLGPKSRPIEDIDLLVWDKGATFALAISLKWLYGPDSVYEVRRHDERFQQALTVHRRCLAELEAHKLDISRSFGLDPPLAGSTKIGGIIVSKMARPTEMIRDE